MATTLYPTTTASSRTSSDWTPTPVTKVLSLSRGSGATTQTDNTQGFLGTIVTASGNQLATMGGGTLTTFAVGALCPLHSPDIVFISEPLNAVTIAGTITVNHRALENSAMANYGCQSIVGKVASGNGASIVIGVGGNTTEIGVAEAATSISITPTSTALAAGDMLFVALCYGAAGGSSATGFTASTVYAGAAGATGDTFVTFTETIALLTAAASQPYTNRYPPLLAQ